MKLFIILILNNFYNNNYYKNIYIRIICGFLNNYLKEWRSFFIKDHSSKTKKTEVEFSN